MNPDPPVVGDSRRIYSRRLLKAIAARWDARAESWDHALQDSDCHLNEDDAYGRFTRVVQRLIARRRRFCASHGVIDMGCGTGLVLGEAIPAFAWGLGIDISPKMIRIARAKRLGNAKFIVGDCFDLPSLCPKAGVILSRGVLLSHYGPGQGQLILRAARAALAPGGFAAFDFLSETGRIRHRHAPESKTWFTRDAVQSLARRAGFSGVKIAGGPTRRVLLLVAKA